MRIHQGSLFVTFQDSRDNRDGVQRAKARATLVADESGKACGILTAEITVWPPESLTGRNAREKMQALLNYEKDKPESKEAEAE